MRSVTCSVFVLVALVASKAFADDDYYQALAQAEQATGTADYVSALRVVDAALRSYPADYELTLARARLELQLMHYADAEHSFRSAVAISDGAAAARLGLGWALVLQHACSAAVREFQAVLALAGGTDNEHSAQRGIERCRPRPGVHGSGWVSLGGALFRDHPWKRRFGDATLGLSLQPSAALLFGLAYHFLRVTASDARVAEVDQHELYLQTGVVAGAFYLFAHAAMVWSADPRTDGSAHGGLSGRYLDPGRLLEEVSVEVTASRYPDVWVARLASAWRFAFGSWSVAPGIALTKHRDEYLTAVSLSLAKRLGALSFWITGKYGPEYRAAYLSQFALLNGEDRSVWSLAAGVRAALTERWSLLATYLLLHMRTPDSLPASMHLVNVGAVYSF